MIFIKGNVPSSKNSRRIVTTGGKRRSIASNVVMHYRGKTNWLWVQHRQEWLKSVNQAHKCKNERLLVGFHFVRDSKRRFDFVNPVQTVQDQMVRHGWLKDDNCDEMLPFPLEIEGRYYSYDKENPGVWITIIK